MMSFRAACFLLWIVAVSSEGLDDPRFYQFSAIKPGDKGSTHDTLEILIQYTGGEAVLKVQKILLYQSLSGDPIDYKPVAGINDLLKSKLAEKTKYDFNGELNNPTTRESKFDLVWKDAEYGYCRSYAAMVLLEDVAGQAHSLYKTIVLGPPAGFVCTADGLIPSSTKTSDEQGEKPSHTEIPEYIQDAFPDTTQEEREQILDKILSIDNNTYNVSSIYEGRVYIATMSDTNFELHKMNELCKNYGGYLVELDSPEEEFFVRDFLTSLGSYHYFIGANDVDSEGNFVNYNSKRPVTNVVWQRGEPNSGGGNENCVQIMKRGLNDQTCSRARGYICEIPLVEEEK